jgi:hypothetical protein
MMSFYQFTILCFYIFYCSTYFTEANQRNDKITHNVPVTQTQNATIKSSLGHNDGKLLKNKTVLHRYYNRKDFIPNIQISDNYLLKHMPLMPLLDDAQKRTTLREKEMNFYGSMISDRSLPTSKGSHLKEDRGKVSKHDEPSSKTYGR